jgi:hypothetical protein
MKTRYIRYTLQGEHSAADAQTALGEPGTQGLVVRVDTGAGETQIYLATERTLAAMSAKLSRGIKAKEVSASEVTKIF